MPDALQRETARCPLCGESEARHVWPTRDRLCGVPGVFALVCGAVCGLLYLNPRPSPASLGAYYPSSYDPFLTTALSPLQRAGVEYGLRKRCRLVQRHHRPGRLLDVGCATGQFADAMQRYGGWQAMGVDLSPEAAGFARETFGLEVHTGDLFSADYSDGFFDAITLWDVIEHLYNPVETLREVRRVLAPGGILVLRTPSLDSWDARAFGPYWAGLDSPRHLTVFGKATMRRLLQAAGFGFLEARTGSGSYFVCLLSLRFYVGEKFAASGLGSALLRLAGHPVMRVATSLPLFAADAAGLGSEMVIVARLRGNETERRRPLAR